MVVSLLKNLSLKDTSDPFIRDLYNNFSTVITYINTFESMYGQIKNYRVYNRGTDTLDTDFKLKYQSIKAPWSFTSGYTGGALRFTTGPSS